MLGAQPHGLGTYVAEHIVKIHIECALVLGGSSGEKPPVSHNS